METPDAAADGRLTARDVLFADPTSAETELEAAMAENDAVIEAGRADDDKGAGGVAKAAAKAVDQVLGQLVIDELLMFGWLQVDELREALTESKVDGQRRSVAMTRHSIVSDHAPHLDLVVNERHKKLTELSVSLSFTISSCDLVVEGGRVTGVELGALRAGCDLSVAGVSVAGRETDGLDVTRIRAWRSEPEP